MHARIVLLNYCLPTVGNGLHSSERYIGQEPLNTSLAKVSNEAKFVVGIPCDIDSTFPFIHLTIHHDMVVSRDEQSRTLEGDLRSPTLKTPEDYILRLH